MEKGFTWIGLLVICASIINIRAEETKENVDREGKVLPVFQVVRFPNDGCVVSSGSKNGTCYTAEECSDKGGTNAGSCASGFGVCCTFTVGCGSTSSENCTYFEVTGASNGPCTSKICKVNDNICQIRLDFVSFIITGPQTATASVGKNSGVLFQGAQKNTFNFTGKCITDAFTVGGGVGVPPLCGTLTGDHIYFDVEDDCFSLDFSFGQNAVGNSKPSSRNFDIKVNQLSCNLKDKAPPGCLQWFTGKTGVGTITNFNYANGYSLADQLQTICFRREEGMCRQCFSAATLTDVILGGKNTKGLIKGSLCCGYGTKGTKTTGGDCLQIPNAIITAGTKKPSCIAGGVGGLVTASGTTSKTLCTKIQPFRIEYITDGWNVAIATHYKKGFSLNYYQTSC